MTVRRALLALFLLSGCDAEAQSSRTEIGTAQQSLAETENGREVAIADGVSVNPVVLVWNDSRPSIRGNVFSVDAINTTGHSIGVDVSLVAASPNGEVASKPLGRRVLRPNASTAVRFPATAIPVQSVGVATPITVIATYRDDHGETRTTMPFVTEKSGHSLLATTKARYLEFDDPGFKAATLRTTAAEVEANSRRGNAQLVALRQIDSDTGNTVERELRGQVELSPVRVVSKGGTEPQHAE